MKCFSEIQWNNKLITERTRLKLFKGYLWKRPNMSLTTVAKTHQNHSFTCQLWYKEMIIIQQ